MLNVTDFLSLWQCSLDSDQFISEAQTQNCSIDPSESRCQADTLRKKLHEALEDGQNVLYRPQHQASDNDFTLKTTKLLPKPLKPLVWAFSLVQTNTAMFSDEVVKPCLQRIAVQNHKLDSLLQIIKDKDHVISRLLDKIEGSAIDLSLIFPGITGLKSRKSHIGVPEAKKHVPGMSTFDQTAWDVQVFEPLAEKRNLTPGIGFSRESMPLGELEFSTTADWVYNLRTESHVGRDMPSLESFTEKLSQVPVKRLAQKAPSAPGSRADSEVCTQDPCLLPLSLIEISSKSRLPTI